MVDFPNRFDDLFQSLLQAMQEVVKVLWYLSDNANGAIASAVQYTAIYGCGSFTNILHDQRAMAKYVNCVAQMESSQLRQ